MKSQPIVVLTTPTIIAGANAAGTGAGPGSVSYPTACLIRIPTGAPVVYMGGSSVTVSTGTPFVAGEDIEVDLVNEILYAVTNTVTTTIYVLRRGD